MLRSSESETEILLGNKQLLGIFFVVVVLLGVAFVGGYKVGQASGRKAPVAAQPVPDNTASSGATSTGGGETHTIPGAAGSGASSLTHAKDTADYQPPTGEDDGPPLGSPHNKNGRPRAVPVRAPSPAPEDAASILEFTPQSGQTFLQVAAVGRDEAEAIADVLHKKGFHAHAVPKPGGNKLYRVLIGPVRDASDLSSTRESLRRTGFREIFVQRY
jgi:cell division septation protein DedD